MSFKGKIGVSVPEFVRRWRATRSVRGLAADLGRPVRIVRQAVKALRRWGFLKPSSCRVEPLDPSTVAQLNVIGRHAQNLSQGYHPGTN